MAVNPKEYLELFEDKNVNKKHKGIKKGSSGMGFENFAQRIGSLVNFDTFGKPPADTKQVSRLTVAGGEMVKTSVVRNKFSQSDNRRFYFPDGVVSLPFYHLLLSKKDEFKQEKGQKTKKYFWEEKEHLFRLEEETLRNHPRLYLYHKILMSVPKIFNISQKDDFTQQIKTLFKRNTKDIILEGGWIMK